MTLLDKLVNALNEDLSREYAHWNFYVHSSVMVQGLHREEISEFLLGQANEEMAHIIQWKKLILGLGYTPTCEVAPFTANLVEPLGILEEALRMEDEVVGNFVDRIKQANELYDEENVSSKWIELFLEDQVIDSRGDADNMREMVKKVGPANVLK